MSQAFRDRGHECWSCDLLPTRGDKRWHYQMDIFQCLEMHGPFDLCIFHPPCQHLCNAGARYWKEKQRTGVQQASIEFVLKLWRCNSPRVCIENPRGILSTMWRKPDVVTSPHEHGSVYRKLTCLWTRGLPPLEKSNVRTPTHTWCTNNLKSGKRKDGSRKVLLPPAAVHGSSRQRSQTDPHLARAFADQWGVNTF